MDVASIIYWSIFVGLFIASLIVVIYRAVTTVRHKREHETEQKIGLQTELNDVFPQLSPTEFEDGDRVITPDMGNGFVAEVEIGDINNLILVVHDDTHPRCHHGANTKIFNRINIPHRCYWYKPEELKHEGDTNG